MTSVVYLFTIKKPEPRADITPIGHHVPSLLLVSLLETMSRQAAQEERPGSGIIPYSSTSRSINKSESIERNAILEPICSFHVRLSEL